MSDITGQGYGYKHDWVKGETNQQGFGPPLSVGDKFTEYSCRKCGVEFRHFYDITEDIFEVIEEAKIPEECEIKF